MLSDVLKEFDLDNLKATIVPFGKGLINSTWKISVNGNAYILQQINQHVFKKPEDIAYNLHLIAEFLQEHEPGYRFIAPIQTVDGLSLLRFKNEGYYRAFPFVKNSHSIDVVESPDQAYEAAKQFGRFTRLLKGFDVSSLKITIPSFHDLGLRYSQFLAALENGNKKRIAECRDLILQLTSLSYINDEYEEIKRNPEFKLRVTHHDTKISNVLFDKDDKGLCVIDLDTIMPGYFISDVGDMMRTYLSPVGEEETDLGKIEVRSEFYKAIEEGYLSEMKNQLTETEKKHFFYSGIFMTYMQAIRFLTDYINDDVYYGEKYPGHNLNRAKNQTTLLQQLIEKEKELSGLL